MLSSAFFKDVSVPYSANEQMHKKLWGSIMRAADPNWPEEYSTPQNTVPSIYTGEADWQALITLCGMGWALISR